MLHFRFFSGVPVGATLAGLICLQFAGQPSWAAQDKPQEKFGPKVEPAAMGSDYQPLLWRGADGAFALDTFRFGNCQMESSRLVSAKSSNPDVQQVAARSVELQEKNSKKLRSMAKVIDFKLPSQKHKAQQATTCAEAVDLSALSGEDFERSYLAYLTKDNAADLVRFQAEADALPDSANFELCKFADAALPLLTEQQRSIEALNRKLAPASK